jgi:hypothetical protein
MAVFRPPTDDWLHLSDFDVDTPPTQEMIVSYSLLRFFRAMPRGRNVYLLDTGTYTENEPSDMTTVRRTYQGGHEHQVTADEVASLTAAGYGAYISES